jgi:ribosomal protein L37AE/L43A
MNNCPCCSHTMLRHIRQHQVYWFCRHCWQEIHLPEKKSPHLGLSTSPSILGSKDYSLTSV